MVGLQKTLFHGFCHCFLFVRGGHSPECHKCNHLVDFARGKRTDDRSDTNHPNVRRLVKALWDGSASAYGWDWHGDKLILSHNMDPN